MRPTFHERYRYLLLGAFACLVPLAAWGAFQALATNANDVRTWLPQGLPEVREYAEFGRHFGSEEFVAVSWEGCTLDDPRIERLAERLKQFTSVSDDAEHAERNQAADDVRAPDDSDSAQPRGPALLESVVTGPEALSDLTSSLLRLTHTKAVARLRGLMIGPDGRQTCLLVRPTERGKRDPLAVLAVVRKEAVRAGVPRNSLRMGGPLVTSSSIDQAASSSLAIPGPLSLVAALLFSWICFRSLRLTLPVIAIGAFGGAAALAIVWYSGGMMNAVLLSMPPLVYVATTSGAIHFANYYRDAVSEKGVVGAPSRAAAHARLPLVLATATTAMGLLTLYASELLPIRDFGVYSAAGVAASLIWLLIVLPAVYAVWPLRALHGPNMPAVSARPAGEPAASSTKSEGARRRINWWTWGERVTSASFAVSAVCLLAATLCGLGLSRVKTSVSAEEFFADDAELPRTSRWMESRLGGMVPMEMVIRFPAACQLNVLERMELIGRVQRSVASLDQVSASISALTFSPPLPKKSVRGANLRRAVFIRQFERKRGRVEATGFLASDGGDELWRVSLRTRSFHNVDQRYFIDEVRAHVEPVLAARRKNPDVAITASFTGMVPLIERSQQSLLEGLGLGLMTDLVLIVLTMVILMRHWAPGMVMLAACILPTLVVLGLMGWLGITLDIGTVLAPSVALGVSVDDVLHFVLWFRRGLEQGLDRRQSIRLAYSGCARAMFQSWGVIGLGLGIFALSDFAPTHRFGLLMLLLVTVSLVANLVLLPALLAGPLGGCFAKSVQRKLARRTLPLADSPTMQTQNGIAPPSGSHPDRANPAADTSGTNTIGVSFSAGTLSG